MAKRILCIEDDPGMRESVRLILESTEYQVSLAEDGMQGLQAAIQLVPDLILCDIRMPGMDGFQTLAELRKHETTAHIPFIFLTGEDPRYQMRKGMNLGADDFILKPFNVDDLIKTVEVRLAGAEKAKSETRRAVDELSENITRALPHELRTPMTGILGLAEVLKTQAEEMTPEEVKDFAKSLFDSAVRMNQTLEKFWIHTQCLMLPHDQKRLDASRQAGSKDAEAIVLRTVTELATDHGRPSDVVLQLSPIAVAVAERYFEQIIRQIADNALKFSERHSTILVTTASQEGKAVVTVEDHGRGMSEDQIRRINMFMQFERERQEQQGLGLGLMIARRLTEIHDGTLRIESTAGKGTIVSITLPLLIE